MQTGMKDGGPKSLVLKIRHNHELANVFSFCNKAALVR